MTELEGLGELGELGRVDPPAASILDSAREVLWSAVAVQMLATAPPGAADAGTARADTPHADAAHADAAHADAAHADAAHAGGESGVGQATDDLASQPRPEDPGAP